MKPKQKIISLLLTICLVVGLMPTAAFAAGTDTGNTIQLGTSGISGYDSTNGYDYIYYGKWDSSAIKWRVLATKTNTGGESGLFLLSDALLGTDNNGGVYFDNSRNYSNVWQNSKAKEWCGTFYNGNFSEGEKGAVLATTKSDVTFKSSNTVIPPFATSENILNGDKVFFLSAEEAENSTYGFTDDTARIANYGNRASVWWLRSPLMLTTTFAGVVTDTGVVHASSVNDAWAARPAFNLNLNSVLFTSAAVGGKIPAAEAADAIFEIGEYAGNEWKLTLLDSSREFAISNATANSSDGTIAFSYSGAQTGTNEYISAVVKDNGAITHYGRILQLDGTENGESGTASLVLPTGVTLDNDTKLYVFNEQYNGGEKDNTKLTDYASNLIAVNVDTTAPTLTGGGATRTSETAATVKFTSNEAGEYYYAVVESGDTAPTIDTTVAGTSCDTTEQTISLTNLSGAGAKDIYIVAKDAAGNVSQQLKITIPAYIAPSYGISASPAALDFGSKTAGYTEAPAAQTVTLTNTGNQTVTVNLPVGANYTITAGDSFAGGTATLAPNGTAAFTVQPNTGLGVGTYAETLTVSGGNNVSASIELSFTVLETYTLTVDLNGGSGSTIGGEYTAGEVVNIDAGSRSNYRFDGWTSSNGGSFADASSASTTFIMPAANTTITANWKYNGGGGYIPTIQKPTIEAGEGVKVTLSADGTVATITVDPAYELADVVLNGVSKGKVSEVKGLKTGDKLVVTAAKKATEPTSEDILATLADQKLVARSKVVTMKNGKKAVRITWYNANGEMMEFDGVEIYRSVKRNSGYGKKPIFTSETDKYYNTAIKAGTKYYYKVRGFVVIDGQKYYTDWSLKAWRTVK